MVATAATVSGLRSRRWRLYRTTFLNGGNGGNATTGWWWWWWRDHNPTTSLLLAATAATAGRSGPLRAFTIDYAGLVDELRLVAKRPWNWTNGEFSLKRIAALYQRIRGMLAALLEQADGEWITAERAYSQSKRRARPMRTRPPRDRYQWVGGADGDLFQVEDTETKPVERIELDDA